jgi:hypothetical protein
MSIKEIILSRRDIYSIFVDHIDRNKLNNNIENLRWVTRKENALNQNNVYVVEQWSLDKKNLISTYNSQSEASQKNGISSGSISLTCNGFRNSAGGFFWKFAET